MTSDNKNRKAHPRTPVASGSGKTRIGGPVLDRLIREKMARTPECEGIAALPVTRVGGGREWRVPGYTGDVHRIPKCEAAIRDYLEFLATQFELADD